jgi:tRNA pseudouridine38-40 synthase
VVFTFRANVFLHHMVRNLVGSLVHGRRQASARLDRRAARVARSHPGGADVRLDGLYLAAIEYDPAFGFLASAHPLLEQAVP